MGKKSGGERKWGRGEGFSYVSDHQSQQRGPSIVQAMDDPGGWPHTNFFLVLLYFLLQPQRAVCKMDFVKCVLIWPLLLLSLSVVCAAWSSARRHPHASRISPDASWTWTDGWSCVFFWGSLDRASGMVAH